MRQESSTGRSTIILLIILSLIAHGTIIILISRLSTPPLSVEVLLDDSMTPDQQQTLMQNMPHPHNQQPAWATMMGGAAGSSTGRDTEVFFDTHADPYAAPVNEPATPDEPTDEQADVTDDTDGPPDSAPITQPPDTPSLEDATATAKAIATQLVAFETEHATAPSATTPPAAIAKKRPARKKTASRKHSAAPKSKITMADFVQSFLRHSLAGPKGSGGDDGISMHGARQGPPTPQQLMIRRYTEKVVLAAQKRFNAHRQQLPVNWVRTSNPVDLIISLDSQGNVQQLAVVGSSGIVELDGFALAVFHDAQGTYPSIPHELGMMSYDLKIHDALRVLLAPVSSGILKQE